MKSLHDARGSVRAAERRQRRAQRDHDRLFAQRGTPGWVYRVERAQVELGLAKSTARMRSIELGELEEKARYGRWFCRDCGEMSQLAPDPSGRMPCLTVCVRCALLREN